jgi:hypothetical protein
VANVYVKLCSTVIVALRSAGLWEVSYRCSRTLLLLRVTHCRLSDVSRDSPNNIPRSWYAFVTNLFSNSFFTAAAEECYREGFTLSCLSSVCQMYYAALASTVNRWYICFLAYMFQPENYCQCILRLVVDSKSLSSLAYSLPSHIPLYVKSFVFYMWYCHNSRFGIWNM